MLKLTPFFFHVQFAFMQLKPQHLLPVLGHRELLDYVECMVTDRWFEPPMSFDWLGRTFLAAVHHSSPLNVKHNILTSTFTPHPFLSGQVFSRFIYDYLVFGNAYLEERTNRLGGGLSLELTLAKFICRGYRPGHLLVRSVRLEHTAVPVRSRQRLLPDVAGPQPGNLRPAGIPFRYSVHAA